MPARLKLETFDEPARTADVAAAAAMAPEAVEDVRLASYEKGYSAGWEDAIAAQSDDQLRIREDLARSLRDLAFTYQEARSHLLRSIDPLLRGMADQVLPEIAQATLGAAVVAELMEHAASLASAPVEIMVAPADRAAIEAALGDDPPLPLSLKEEPTLAVGQVHFRLGEEERALDLDAVLTAIRGLIADFLNDTEERQARHG